MAFTPFIESDQPTMAAFNEKFSEAISTAINGALDADIKVETGSYTGTGKYGKSNPNRLTFDFVPKLVIVSGQGNSSNTGAGFIYCWGSKKYTLIYASYGGAQTTCVVSSADKTMNWYDTQLVDYQCNNSKFVFNYIAIG